MKTYRDWLKDELIQNGDSWNNVEYCTLTESQLLCRFPKSFNDGPLMFFMIWTGTDIYFPIVSYEQKLNKIVSVPRNPDPYIEQRGFIV